MLWLVVMLRCCSVAAVLTIAACWAAAPAPRDGNDTPRHDPPTPKQADDSGDGGSEAVGDAAGAVESDAAPPAKNESAARAVHPLAAVSDAELERRVQEDIPALGPVSLGHPAAGLLWNGVQMPEGEGWVLVHPHRAWGTPETVESIARAINKVREQFPNTPKLWIGNLSKESGGRMPPHSSHQAGRDVDIGLYYKTPEPWYTEANEENIDLPRTWALIRALVTETDVELIFFDISFFWLIRNHAREIGEDREWVWNLFKKGEGRRIVQHEPGHKTHLHVRFFNPVAQETGRRIYPLAVKNKLFKARNFFIPFRARKNDTVESIVKRYRTSRGSFRKANGARAGKIRPGRSYKILRFGPVDPGETPEEPVVIPPRMLPPG